MPARLEEACAEQSALVVIVGYTDKRIQMYTEREGKVRDETLRSLPKAYDSSRMRSRWKDTRTVFDVYHLRYIPLQWERRRTCS